MNSAQIQVQTPQLGFGEQKGIQQMYSQSNQSQIHQYKSGAQQQQQQAYQYQQQQQQQNNQQSQLPQHNQSQQRKINENQVLIEQQQSQYVQQHDISKQQIPYQKGGDQVNQQQQYPSLQQNQQQLQLIMQQPLSQKTQYQQLAHQYQSSPEKMKGQSSPQQDRYQQYQNQTVRSPNHVNQLQAQHQKKSSKIPDNTPYQIKKNSDTNQYIASNNQIAFKPTNESLFNFVYSVPKLIEPNPLDCVLEADNELGGLFIGNLDAALSVEILKKSRIRAVLTTSIETGFRYAEESIHFHECLPAHDKEGYDITIHFEKGIEFIERNRKYTSVLVHCFAGVSRSASICIAYMMKKNRWTLEKALWHLKKCRRLINPNTGFIKKLTQYEQYLISKGHYNPQSAQFNGVFDNTPAVSDTISYSPNVNKHEYGGIYSKQNGQIMTYNLDNQPELPIFSDPNLVMIHQQPTANQQQVLLNPNQSPQQVGYIDIIQQPQQFQQIASQPLNSALQQQQYQLQQQQVPENGKQYMQLQQQQNQQQPLSVIQQVNQLKQTQYLPKPTIGGQQQSSGQKQPYGGENNQPLNNQQQQQAPSQPVGIQILANNEQFLQNQKQLQAQQEIENKQKQKVGYQNQAMNHYQPQGVYQQQHGQQSSQQQQQYQQQPILQQVKNKQPIFKQQQMNSQQI